MSILTRSRLGLAVVGCAAILMLTTACGAQNADSQKPQESGSTSSSSSSGDPDKEFLDWQLKFAECMRAEGVDMPDPNADGSVSATAPEDPAAWEAAMRTCEEKLGNPPARDGRSDQEVLDEQLKTAKCLRDAGYDVEDPKSGEAMGIPEGVTEEDLKACGLQFGG